MKPGQAEEQELNSSIEEDETRPAKEFSENEEEAEYQPQGESPIPVSKGQEAAPEEQQIYAEQEVNEEQQPDADAKDYQIQYEEGDGEPEQEEAAEDEV